MGVNEIDMERHKKRHHQAVKFMCEICNENYIDEDTLTTHMTMHNFMQYECNACGNTFNDEFKYVLLYIITIFIYDIYLNILRAFEFLQKVFDFALKSFRIVL